MTNPEQHSDKRKDMASAPGRRSLLQAIGAGGALTIIPGWVSLAHGQQATRLRVRIGADISILDPARIFQIENQSVAANIYSGLVKYDEASNQIVPDLATSWTVSPDAKVYTFKLRTGVTWHKDFGAFSADDVKFSFDRVLDPATGSAYRGQIADVIQSVEAPDAATVRFVLTAGNAEFLHKVTAFNNGWIVSRKAVTQLADKYNLNPIGTGPFVFAQWVPGSEVRLTANPQYFGGAPKVQELVFRLIRDETAAAIALEKGEIDIFFAMQQPEVIERLRKTAGVKVLERPASATLNLVLNTSIKPMDDVRVRRAIAHAINRKALVEGFFRNTKYEARTVLTSAFPENTGDVPVYAYDPDRARALLKEAGVSNMRFEITTPGLSPYDKLVVPIANDLNQVGIATTVRVLERAAYQQARSSGNVQSCVTAVVGPPDPSAPLVTLLARKSFPPGLNSAKYDGIEDLLKSVSSEVDAGKRKQIYASILSKVATDVPVVPLYADRLFMAHSDKVDGLVQNSMFTVQCFPVRLKGA
jgi:peptide/nickel transport system substrate-binding protein